MRRCALSSPPKILTGHSPPQCIWAVQMHSLTGPLKPTTRSSHREVEYELFLSPGGQMMPDEITTVSLNGWYFAVTIQSALLREHHAHLCEYLCESIG